MSDKEFLQTPDTNITLETDSVEIARLFLLESSLQQLRYSLKSDFFEVDNDKVQT